MLIKLLSSDLFAPTKTDSQNNWFRLWLLQLLMSPLFSPLPCLISALFNETLKCHNLVHCLFFRWNTNNWNQSVQWLYILNGSIVASVSKTVSLTFSSTSILMFEATRVKHWTSEKAQPSVNLLPTFKSSIDGLSWVALDQRYPCALSSCQWWSGDVKIPSARAQVAPMIRSTPATMFTKNPSIRPWGS